MFRSDRQECCQEKSSRYLILPAEKTMSAPKLWKTFAAVGSAVGTLSQFHDGAQGKAMGWPDIGPQAFPKFTGQLLHGYNAKKQMEGNWAVAEHCAKLIAETPPLTTNYPNRPIIKY